MAKNLLDQTGKDVSEWVRVLADAGLATFAERVTWLKATHQLGHFQARMIAEAMQEPPGDPPGTSR